MSAILNKLKKLVGGNAQFTEWHYRTKHADDYFQQWALRYHVAECLDYYTGRQWRNLGNYPNYEPYVINLVYSTIKVKRPSLLFSKPIYHLTPKPSPDFSSFNYEDAAKRVALKQDVLNNWVTDRKNYFPFETKQSIMDAFFGFGIIESGYSANYINNPDLQKPAYGDSNDPTKVTKEPDEVPSSERTFIKRVPFLQFRVGSMDSPILERNNWVGYWEYVDRRDLENAEGYEYSAENYSGNRSSEIDSIQSPFGFSGNLDSLKDFLKKGDLVKIWKIWDFRDHVFKVWAENTDEIIFADEFDNNPFSRLAFDENLYGFYPIPPVSQWLSSQDEVNESSEQLRVHRRRSNRRYMVGPDVDDLELQKVLNGPDGTFGKFEGNLETLVVPVPQAPMDQSNTQAFLQSKDNFNIVSQTSSEMRGNVDRQTATAAAISNQSSQITEAEPKEQVAMWLSDIGCNVLSNLAISVLPFWVKRMATSPQLGSSVNQQPQYQKVSGQELEGDDYDANVLTSSLSPIDSQAELQTFNTFVGMLNQYPEFALSPIIIREIATKCNYTNEAVIEEFQKIATLKMMGLQQGNGAGQNGGDPSQQGVNGTEQAGENSVQNQGSPAPQAINAQLNGQVQ